jgi:glutathione S-transferase
MGFDENQYFDVLQNIEFAIIEEFRRDPAILDLNVREAVNVLARQYESEEEGRTPPRAQMTDRTRAVFDAVRTVCEWRMGRPRGPVLAKDDPPVPDIAVAEMAACLKRIRKSVDLWSKESGPRGYLNFVRQYIV